MVELALPLFFRDADSGRRLLGSITVYSTPLEDVEANVDLVRRAHPDRRLLALAAAVLAASSWRSGWDAGSAAWSRSRGA